jgi:glutathione S-transferase
MLRIWGRTNSVNVKKALWCAEELGLQYERIDAGLQFGVNKTPEYLKMNPTGLVPTIDDDGFVLWESHSIVRYLCAKHGAGKLWPTDLQRRADAERWMDWAFTFQRAMRDVFWGLIRTPPEKRDARRSRKASSRATSSPRCSTARSRARPTSRARSSPWATSRSAARCSAGCACRSSDPSLSHLEGWFERLRARPPFAKHVDIPLT